MSRPNKRTRTVATFHRDEVDIDEAVRYEEIEVREGRLHKTGVNTVSESLPIRMPLEIDSGNSSAWMNLTSWSVTDDTTLALDPSDGQMYERALEQGVMEDSIDQETEVQTARKRHNRSRVSVGLLYGQLHRLTDSLLPSETASCRLERCPSRDVLSRDDAS